MLVKTVIDIMYYANFINLYIKLGTIDGWEIRL